MKFKARTLKALAAKLQHTIYTICFKDTKFLSSLDTLTFLRFKITEKNDISFVLK